MTINLDNFDKDEDFNREFWKWFDSLNKNEKNRFWYYQLDMSKLYFYNKHYVKLRADRFITNELSTDEYGLEAASACL